MKYRYVGDGLGVPGLPHEITDEDRDRAFNATVEFLTRIDIKRIDDLRRQLELPPEAIGTLVEVFVTQLGASGKRTEGGAK